MRAGALFKIHSVAGLLSGLFIVLMSLSGSALVFHEELDSLQSPRILQKNDAPLLGIDSGYAALRRAFPHAQVSNCYVAENISQPYLFTVYDPSFENGTKAMQVFLHPQTAEVLGTRGASSDARHNFPAWLAAFHNSFHLGKTGEWLLGSFSVVFVIGICTGFALYRKNIIAVLSFRRKMLRLANLHQWIGVYALLFNLMIGITGFWMQRYVFKKDFYAAVQPYTPVLKPSPAPGFSIDSALADAKRYYPSFTGYVIYFAPSTKRKTAVYGSRSLNSFIHSKKFADVLYLDSTGRIAKTGFVTDIESSSRYDIINAQLHYGRYGGWPVKLLYGIFGLTGGLLSITGSLLWWRRRKR